MKGIIDRDGQRIAAYFNIELYEKPPALLKMKLINKRLHFIAIRENTQWKVWQIFPQNRGYIINNFPEACLMQYNLYIKFTLFKEVIRYETETTSGLGPHSKNRA
jgi:hypothetical protein